MEIAWEGRPCGPKGCKGRKSLLLSSKHKWQSWKYLFPAPHPHFQGESLQTQISKLTTFHFAKTHISELEIFVSPKPKYQSWKTFHPRPHLKARRICFLHKPKFRSGKYSVVHKNQTFKVGCSPKHSDFNVSFLKAQISTMETWVVCSKHTFQSSTYLLPVQGPSVKVKHVSAQTKITSLETFVFSPTSKCQWWKSDAPSSNPKF